MMLVHRCAVVSGAGGSQEGQESWQALVGRLAMGAANYLGLGPQTLNMSREAVPNSNRCIRVRTDRDKGI